MRPRIFGAVWSIVLLCPLALPAQTLQPGYAVRPQLDSVKFRAARTALDSLKAWQKSVPEIDVFATGAVRDAGAQQNTPAAVTGSLGLRYRGEVFVVGGLINVAAKEDTVRKGYGSTLLVPASGSALNAGLLDIRAPRLPNLVSVCSDPAVEDEIKCHIGLHAYFSASSTRWATSFGTNNAVTESQIVPTWGSGLGLTYSFVNGVLTDGNRVALILDAGLATRHIRGDFTASEFDEIRGEILNGTSKEDLFGLEIALNLQYNTITAGLSYYRMNGEIRGFSNGQVVAGVSLQSTLNSKPLKR